MMSVRRWKVLAVFLPLFAMLAGMIPAHPATVQAARTTTQVVAPAPVVVADTDAEDAALVRQSLQDPIQDDVFYFALPDRFANGSTTNNYGDDAGGSTTADVLRHGYLPSNEGYYHGGDIKGLQSRLPYLDDMGVTAIWMAPIFKNRPVQGDDTINGSSAGYHGYWITDFTQVDPHFGTNAELRALIADAHARDIKVFFDIITNHTADVIDYEEAQYGYRFKKDYPYRDAQGNVFDDRTYAGTDDFPALDADGSFAYTPVFRTPADQTAKVPNWLNSPLRYHNRGNSTFEGESSEYGDFFGLDDLFTEQPEVVDGMIDIYKSWITQFKIDGFRIDTVKHVNIEFWQKFGPEVMAHARSQGVPDFFMFGEVFSGDAGFVSRYTTEGNLEATLDFPFQGSARGFASQSGATNGLRDMFAADDYYTDADSNAYRLPTFLGNHDVGRFGYFLRQDNPSASDAELVARDALAHGLMYFARGEPVVYYGDEQGFTGDGGDKGARQDMFASTVATYNDDDLIGSDRTTAVNNYNQSHPLYQALTELADVREANKALRRGAQIHRWSSDAAGIYAFSRIDRDEQVEYVVALNNATTEQSATFKTFMPSTDFSAVYGTETGTSTNAAGEITVTVPALSIVVLKADEAMTANTTAPSITLTAPTTQKPVTGRVEVAASVGEDRFAEVTFAVKAGDATNWTIIGTDNNAPYRVFYDASTQEPGTPLQFKAIVNDVTDDNGANVGALQSDTTSTIVARPASCAANPTYAIIHYNRPAGDYEGWGLHLWGEAIDPSEATEWTAPKAWNGEDAYGKFAFIRLQDPTKPLNFIIHKGDEKDTDPDRTFVPSASPEVWLMQGDTQIYTGLSTIHYNRPAEDYEGWGLHLWGEGIAPREATEWTSPKQPSGTDDYGVYFNILMQDRSQPVNFIIHKGDEKDTANDRTFTFSANRAIYLKQGDAANYTTADAAGGESVAIIHYYRPDGDYGDATSTNFRDFWGLHVWTGAANPNPAWEDPIRPAGQDDFGIYYRVPLAPGATVLNYILHKGDEKDQPADQALDIGTYGTEVWIIQNEPGYLLPTAGGCAQAGNLDEAGAHWLSRDTLVWNIDGDTAASDVVTLHYDATGAMYLDAEGIVGGESITLTRVNAGLSSAQRAKYPHLASWTAYRVGAADLGKVPAILKGKIALAAVNGAGRLLDATSVQLPGVLDDLYTFNGQLGLWFQGSSPMMRLWAPTAQNVTLHVFDTSTITTSTEYAMTWDAASGTWNASGRPAWIGKYYLYEVEVYAPTTGQVEQNMVTDPYSFSLSMDSTRTQIVNLADNSLKPTGWNGLRKPALVKPEDIVLYELHIRDFSISDPSVPEAERGTYKAFTRTESNGMKHLRALATAGLTTIHLLPTFDIASINENPAERQEADWDELATYAPDSTEQQERVGALADQDGFNWGYDPYHYTAPEGSYATNPDGSTRVVEFREMVQSLNTNGLRVVMDVVYNHTASSGQNDKSVLDRVVPGYYHRLNENTGAVETSTCCQNTATENAMMEKLMIDSVITWATEYKVDGFRFDLMGHHSKANMVKLRQRLNALTVANSGVDGSKIYLYGEGWNFGDDVQNNKRFVQATQLNMAGTGIGTFSDRLRDAVRGGGPFDSGQDVQRQGFINGLSYNPNGYAQGTADDQRTRLLLAQDQIKVGLAGNLRDYTFVDRTGKTVTGKDVDYNGSPTGYAADPQETITYIEAHDNETLFDILQAKAPITATIEDRVRMQNMGNSIVSLGQGIPFFQAAQDLLRSKSSDRNSFNSGDWFNKVDWTGATNNWGVGLPPIGDNQNNWSVYQPLLANPALKPSADNIGAAVDHFQEMLRIRKSSPLFRLGSADEINQRVRFLNAGPDQAEGVIVMSIMDGMPDDATRPAQMRLQNLDPAFDQIMVIFNANDEAQTITNDDPAAADFRLHPLQASSSDPVVRTASYDAETSTFTVPARTTAVFVVGGDNRVMLPLVFK